MVKWLGWLGNLFGSLFRPKGSTQIGSGNQSFTPSTSGENSPVIMAGRDLHMHAPLPGPDEDEVAFAEADEAMPKLFAELRNQLQMTPFLRYMIVLQTPTMAYNWPEEHLRYSEVEEPLIRGMIGVLVGHKFITEEKRGFAYRMTETFVRLLKKGGSPQALLIFDICTGA